MKKIGLIGGAGAFASQHILSCILHNATKKYSPTIDEEFPHIILDNVPFKGFSHKAELNSSIYKQLKKSINLFHHAKCDYIAIACNTLHYYLPNLQEDSLIPIYNLLDNIAGAFALKNVKTVGIICSDTSRELELHKQYLDKHNINSHYISDEDQEIINNIIKDIIAGNNNDNQIHLLNNISNNLLINGCDSVLFGCTELSIPFSKIQKLNTSSNILDSGILLGEHLTHLAFE